VAELSGMWDDGDDTSFPTPTSCRSVHVEGVSRLLKVTKHTNFHYIDTLACLFGIDALLFMQILCYSNGLQETSPDRNPIRSGSNSSSSIRHLNYDEGHTSHFSALVEETSDLVTSPDGTIFRESHPLSNASHPSKAYMRGNRGNAISVNQSSPRLVQSQEKHCARMVMNRTKQSPDLERQQQQKLIMQRMLANKQKQYVSQTDSLHIGPSSKLQHQHDDGRNDAQHAKGTGGNLQEPSYESVPLHRHHQPQSQFVQNQSPHGRGSYTLRHIVDPKLGPPWPSHYERIFEILEVLQVNCRFCHVIHSPLAYRL
jgi:hypothetical protein